MDRSTAWGWLARVLKRERFLGNSTDIVRLAAPDLGSLESIIVVGLGLPESLHCGIAYRAAASAIRLLAERERSHVVFGIAESLNQEQTRAAVAGAVSGVAGQDIYRSASKLTSPEAITWIGVEPATLQAGEAIGQAIAITKRLVNEPPNKIYPESFADQAARPRSRLRFRGRNLGQGQTAS
ncbi:MAG: M17 family peptidase N-terminal domain-containing protein [Pirellulaceae bacterium]